MVAPGLLALVCVAFFGTRVARPWRRRHLLRTAPEVPVSELRSGGLHRVRGRVVSAREHFVGPMSDRPCVYVHFTVEEPTRERGRGGGWVKQVEVQHTTTVELDDGSGRVAVNLARAELVLALDRHVRSGFLASLPEPLARKLEEEYGTATRGWVMNKTLRVRETMLELGDELVVVGQASFGRDGPAFDEGGPLLLVTDGPAARLVARETRALLAWGASGLAVALLSVALAMMAVGAAG